MGPWLNRFKGRSAPSGSAFADLEDGGSDDSIDFSQISNATTTEPSPLTADLANLAHAEAVRAGATA